MQQSYGSHSFFPNIIINADDYGYCQERSTGIIELIKAGCISSTSVIVNSPDSQKACGILNSYLQTQHFYSKHSRSRLSIGLHLNLTEFRPVTTESKLLQNPLIEIQTQLFKGKSYIYNNIEQLKGNKLLSQFVYAQTKSQIQKFVKLFSFKPSHLDSHNHIHIIPFLAQPVSKACSMFGIYKTRLPIQISISNIHQNIDSYNKKFIGLASESKKIYDREGFIWPDYFVGLDSMGKYIIDLQNRVRSIWSQLKPLDAQGRTIQIMVHPGYRQSNLFLQHKTCQFSKSSQRQDQLQFLKSWKIREWSKVESFNSLKKRRLEQSVLIYSKLVKSTGNLTTSLRLKQILQEVGFRVYFLDVPENNKFEGEDKRIREMVENFAINFIIGVNLTRTSEAISEALKDFPIPYFLMIAGTDANITFNLGIDKQLRQIYKGIEGCETLISLSEHMLQKVQKHLQQQNIDKKIVLIKQSTINEKSNGSQGQDELTNFNIIQKSKPYIVFPTSFRKVKDVGHVIEELNHLIDKYSINVYVFGPIIDQVYFTQIEKSLGKVKYLHCLPHHRYLCILKQASLLINCSESEGMSCSILQAFCERVPVLVRQNSGNCQLVRDKENGLLYKTGEQFIQKFEFLMKNYEWLKASLCQTAYKQVKQKYSRKQQVSLYKKMIGEYYKPLTYQVNLRQIWGTQLEGQNLVSLFHLNGVHKISPTNLRIFHKFFDHGGKQGKKDGCFYLDKILEKSDSIQILDIGCGTGVFAIFFIINLVLYLRKQEFQGKVIKLKLSLADFDKKSINNTFVNLQILNRILSLPFNSNILLEKATAVHSDMFSQLYQDRFDIILGNMPQTPFRKADSRVDKNGGQSGLKFTQILIKQGSKHLKNKQSFVLMLYSYMQSSEQFEGILKENRAQILWSSSKQTHTIKKQQFEEMQRGLVDLLKGKIEQNKSNARFDDCNFYVDAELRLLMYL